MNGGDNFGSLADVEALAAVLDGNADGGIDLGELSTWLRPKAPEQVRGRRRWLAGLAGSRVLPLQPPSTAP